MVGPFGLHPNKTMQSRAFSLARPLAAQGHQVCLFMPPWQTPNEADRRWQQDDVEFRYTAVSGGVLAISRRLIRETLAWKPDVVHCFKPKAYSGLTAWWLWQFHRQQLRLVVDTDDWEGWGGWNDRAPYSIAQKHFFAWQERWGLRHCHAVTAASRTLESLAWSLGLPPDRVRYVPNGPGISPEPQESGEPIPLTSKLGDRPVLLLYSRLFEFDTKRLVAVLRGVKAAVPEMAVLAIGAGLYESDDTRFREQLAEAGLEESFIDAGWVEPEHLPALLAAGTAGIYLMEDTLLNRTKCPVKLADMLSAGVPVVAEAVGQVSEYVVHDRTGLLYPQGDVGGLTVGLIRLLGDEALRNRLSTGAQEHILANFSWARLAKIVESVYSA